MDNDGGEMEKEEIIVVTPIEIAGLKIIPVVQVNTSLLFKKQKYIRLLLKETLNCSYSYRIRYKSFRYGWFAG